MEENLFSHREVGVDHLHRMDRHRRRCRRRRPPRKNRCVERGDRVLLVRYHPPRHRRRHPPRCQKGLGHLFHPHGAPFLLLLYLLFDMTPCTRCRNTVVEAGSFLLLFWESTVSFCRGCIYIHMYAFIFK